MGKNMRQWTKEALSEVEGMADKNRIGREGFSAWG